MRAKTLVSIIDGLVLLGGLLWVSTWFVRWAHSPDVRRVALSIFAGALFWPEFRQTSLWVRVCQTGCARMASARAQKIVTSFLILFASSLGIARLNALRVPLYDVGLFHQIFWSLSQGHGFHSTISGAGNFLADHFSPALALLAPVFWLTQSAAWSLQILHPLLIWGGVYAWVFWARREINPMIAGVLLCVTGLSSALWGNLFWGFHENALSFFAQSWFLALTMRSSPLSLRTLLFATVFFLVAATTKETLLLNCAFLVFACGIFRRARGWKTWFMIGLGIVGLLGIFTYFETLPHPADKNYFNRYYAYLGSSLSEVLSRLFKAPFSVFAEVQANVGFESIISYLVQILLPWLGLPILLFKKSPRALVLTLGLLPSLASILLATYAPLRNPSYHYHLELIPILAFLSLLAIRSMPELYRFAPLWILAQFFLLSVEPVEEIIASVRESPQTRAVIAELQKIPGTDVVLANELAGPWVASRLEVARLSEDFKFSGCPQWIVLRRENLENGHLSLSAVSPIVQRSEKLLGCIQSKVMEPQWTHGEWMGYRL